MKQSNSSKVQVTQQAQTQQLKTQGNGNKNTQTKEQTKNQNPRVQNNINKSNQGAGTKPANNKNTKEIFKEGTKVQTQDKIKVEQPQKQENDISQSQVRTQPHSIPESKKQNKQNQAIEIEKKRNFEEQTQFQKQDQQMMVLNKQKQQEIQYYVYADLMNFLGVLTDVLETVKFFEGSEDAAYIPVAINRLVLQSNLSTGIHADCDFNFQSDAEKHFYNKEKQNSQNILMEFLGQTQIPQNQKINECLEKYQKTLLEKAELRMIDPVKVETQGKFNQKTVEQIINGTQQVDFTMKEIQNGKYKKPEKEDIFKHTEERSGRAQLKLAQAYPEMVKLNQQQIKQASKIQIKEE